MFKISPVKLLSVALVTRVFFCPLDDLLGNLDLEPNKGVAVGLCIARIPANAGALV